MSNDTKQRIAGIVCLFGALTMIAAMGIMIPYGLAGEAGKVKLYSVFVAAGFLISLPAAMAYYYYRARINNDKGLDVIRIEAEILASSATEPAKSGQKTVEPVNNK